MDMMATNATTLAYIGDAVFSLQIREYLVTLGYQKPKDLQSLSVHFVSAKAQAKIIHYFIEKELLNETEILYMKRGRNAKTNSIAKNADVITYRNATGFESLWGYLYLTKQNERLQELLDHVIRIGDVK